MKVKLRNVVDALYMVNKITNYYYNPLKNEFFSSDIGDFEELDEDELDELFENSIILPTNYEINQYGMMKEFIFTINNDHVRDKLLRAISYKHPFRNFKNVCFNLDIINDWYKFQDEKYKEIAISWCKENDIEFE